MPCAFECAAYLSLEEVKIVKKRIAIAVVGIVVVVIANWTVRRMRPSTFTFARPSAQSAESVEVSESERTVANESAWYQPDDWPHWRGPHRDAHSASTGLLKDWRDMGPPLAWQVEGLGRGMSSVAIANDRIFTAGKREDGQVYLVARQLASGEPIWATPLGTDEEPNGSPTVDGDRVYLITYNGRLVCAEVASGTIQWQKNFVADFAANIPQWGFSESPLVDGDALVCTPGTEEAVVVAFHKVTGEMLWKSKLPEEMTSSGHAGAGYSSIVISHGAGVRHYVQLVGWGLMGIAPEKGEPLWGYTRTANGTANIPTPIVYQDYVFTSTGYGAGAALLKLTQSPAGLQAEEVYFHPGKDLQNHHGGMILVDGHVYFGHGQNQGFPVCVELMTGKKRWGPVRGPGTGSAAIVYADGHLYFRYQNAVMALVEAMPESYRLVASFQLPSHLGESWPHPVISHERLYLRDQDVLLCYDLSSKE